MLIVLVMDLGVGLLLVMLYLILKFLVGLLGLWFVERMRLLIVLCLWIMWLVVGVDRMFL